jgi:hypothetical protein
MNRKPDVWRETKHIELTGKDGGPVKSTVITKEMEPKEAAQIYAQMLKADKV